MSLLWVYFFPSAVPHPDVVATKAPLPSCAFKIHQPSAASFHFLYLKKKKKVCIIEEHFDLCSLFLFAWPNSAWLWQFLSHFVSWPLTQLSLISRPSFPFLTYILLSPQNPFLVIFFLHLYLHSFPRYLPYFVWGCSVPTFFSSFPYRYSKLLTSVFLSTSVQLTSMLSSLESSKLMRNWKDEFLCFPKSPLHDYNYLQSCFHEDFQLLTVSKLELSFSSAAAGGLQLLFSASRNICGQLFTLIVGSSVEYFGKLHSHSKISPFGTSFLLWTLQSALHCHAGTVGWRITCDVAPSSKQCWPHSTGPLDFLILLPEFSLAVPFLFVSLC